MIGPPASSIVLSCPEHNVADCATCFIVSGECEYGGRSCGVPATYTLRHARDVRHFCSDHATSPIYAFARIGYEVGTST